MSQIASCVCITNIIIYIRSTGNERRQLLQSILRAEDENDEDEDEAPDDEVKYLRINIMNQRKFLTWGYLKKVNIYYLSIGGQSNDCSVRGGI